MHFYVNEKSIVWYPAHARLHRVENCISVVMNYKNAWVLKLMYYDNALYGNADLLIR